MQSNRHAFTCTQHTRTHTHTCMHALVNTVRLSGFARRGVGRRDACKGGDWVQRRFGLLNGPSGWFHV